MSPAQDSLRVHHFEPVSRVNGPGQRAVIWLQGCTLTCPYCFNPETHSTQSGQLWKTDDLLSSIVKAGSSIEGITVSGGEPLQQIRTLTQLLQKVRQETSLSVIVFSGYSLAEAQSMPQFPAFSPVVDVLIAGRYQHELRQAHSLIGSANKECVFFTSRYSLDDLRPVPPAEIFISKDGEITLSGINPISWESTK